MLFERLQSSYTKKKKLFCSHSNSTAKSGPIDLAEDPLVFDLIYILKFSCNFSYFIWKFSKNTSYIAEATLGSTELEIT